MSMTPELQDRDSTIQIRAYELWEQEGRPDGKDLEHWRRAEAEVADSAPPSKGDGLTEAQRAGESAEKSDIE